MFGAAEHIVEPGKNTGKLGKFMACTVEKRDSETLLPLIRNWIRPGSIIHSDGWSVYEQIEGMGLGYSHKVVIHDHEFVTSEGVHTNTIEGAWQSQFKRTIPKKHCNKCALQGQLFKRIWIARHKDRLWEAFWALMRKVQWTDEDGLYLKP